MLEAHEAQHAAARQRRGLQGLPRVRQSEDGNGFVKEQHLLLPKVIEIIIIQLIIEK